MKRFYTPIPPAEGEHAVISGSDAGHIRRVLRLVPGKKIVLFDGEGFDYDAEIVEIFHDRVSVAIVKKYASRPESQARITVAQALLKGKKMDTLIRQMTELGVTRWVPFMAERSVPHPDGKRRADRVARWQTIVKEALKQSRRGEFTQVHPLVSFGEMLALAQSDTVKLVFWENAVESLEVVVNKYRKDSRKIWIVLGPEGGFSKNEIKTAQAHGFEAVGLGSRILRAETAALAACVLMQYIFGDLGK
jgi:16S rRNA (uracil1498-N3)-methyltransferase